MTTKKEHIEFAQIPYTKKELQDYNNEEYPDFCLWCDCGKKVMIGSDFYCLECHEDLKT